MTFAVMVRNNFFDAQEELANMCIFRKNSRTIADRDPRRYR